ncbi:MAG: DUF192 domain-containing protein [Myxococcota bacterium]
MSEVGVFGRAMVMAVLGCALGCVLGCVLGCGGSVVAEVSDPIAGEAVLRVDVDVASTAAERMRGLRGRDALPRDRGLWIEFPVEDELCIVNEGVPFAIDAIWIAGEVVQEVRTFAANDGVPHCARGSDVLEVNAGAASEVRPGFRARRR